MKTYEQLAASVVFSRKGDTITLLNKDSSLQYVGEGRSAFVFRIKHTRKVIKIFFPEYSFIAKEEADIYRQLEGVPYYPCLYAAGNNYIVIDYIEGMTLFSCLTKGKRITAQHIEEIDKALELARAQGLNPSDIHLRNILITNDEKIMLIDVARFRQRKRCKQWTDLKMSYEKYYTLPLFPKKISPFILNKIAELYKKNYFEFLTGKSARI